MSNIHEKALERARLVSFVLKRAGIPHAIAGGLAVNALVIEANGGIAHIRANVDVLIERFDFQRASRFLAEYQLKLIDLKTNRRDFDAVRAIFASEKFNARDLCLNPSLRNNTAFLTALGYINLLITPLLTMKLTAFRAIDQVHVQDLMEANLITPQIEEALPHELRARLESVIAEFANDLECGVAQRI